MSTITLTGKDKYDLPGSRQGKQMKFERGNASGKMPR